MEHALDTEQRAWRGVAKYRVIRYDHLPNARRVVVASGLTQESALAECERLDPIALRQMGHSSTSFYRTIHHIEMENRIVAAVNI